MEKSWLFRNYILPGGTFYCEPPCILHTTYKLCNMCYVTLCISENDGQRVLNLSFMKVIQSTDLELANLLPAMLTHSTYSF